MPEETGRYPAEITALRARLSGKALIAHILPGWPHVIILASLLLTGCGVKKPSVFVGLDDAFRTIRPALSESLSRLDSAGVLPGRKLPGGEYAYGDGPERIAGDLAAAEKLGRKPGLAILSPLIAAMKGVLPENLPVIVVDGEMGPSPSGEVLFLRSDRAAAYRAAGRAAGRHLASLVEADRESGKSRPSCGIIHAPSSSRPASLIGEFEAGYREGWEDALKGKPGVPQDPPPVLTEALSVAGAGDPQDAAIAFVDFSGETNAAVKKLLERDIRILFFACGRVKEASQTATRQPGIIVGIDTAGEDPVSGMAFRIHPDEKSLAKKTAALAKTILAGKDPSDSTIPVPALLIPGERPDLERAGASFSAAIAEARRHAAGRGN